jgi:plastocyanin
LRPLLIALVAALAGAAAGVAAGGGAALPSAATAASAHGKPRHGMARSHCVRWHVRGHRRVCVRRRPVRHLGAPGKGTQTTPGSGQTTTGGGTGAGGTGGTGAGGTTTGGGTTTTTTGPPPLPSRLAVDEYEVPSYRLHPSHNPVAAGTVEFNVYNFGMDPHTFAIHDAQGHQIGGVADVPANQPNTAVVVTADLAPGTYTLLCTLANHAQLGMQATLTVQ